MPSATSGVHTTTCCYCGVGCGIEVQRSRTGKLTIRGDPNHPGSRGLLCSKGRALLHSVAARTDRLQWPQLRRTRVDPLRRVGWDDAIAHAAREFARIRAAHGPDSVAFYVSGQCLTEEYYVANKLVKGFLGTNNIDTNSRLCMSSAVAGYKATLGSDSVPVSYDDLDLTDTFLIAGANPAFAHPIIFRRIEARKAADPQRVRLICIDPRRTATAAVSDLHLPVKPGTDVALFHGLAAELWRTGQCDTEFIAQHVTGWDALRSELERWPLERAAAVCGVAAADLALAASWLGGERNFLSLWTMGLNQSTVGVDKNVALINLSLLTGKIGRPGCGPFSLTGQPNAMGGREVGGLANLLPAHRNLADPAQRAEVARFWGVPSVREQPGLTAMEMCDALHDGRLKAIWVICTNPLASWPDAQRTAEAFRRADLVIAQDIYPTETTAAADLVLPAAGWLEKTGTMTSSERRVTLLDAVVPPPGEALSDTEILCRFARALGHGAAFAWKDEAAIYAEHAALTKGTDCDISGLSHARLRSMRSAQWPVPTAAHPGTPRLFTDHRFATADGRARLQAPGFVERSEPLSAAFPLVLNTGRLRDQWHTMTRTGRVARLSATDPVPRLEIHPEDAVRCQVVDGDVVTVTSARGPCHAVAQVTTDIRPGVVFLPMHWGSRQWEGAGQANRLATARFDPVSKEPDLKFAAVAVAPVRPAPRRILMIGGGAAALGLIEAHLQLSAGGRVTNDTITVLGDEPWGIYNRVALPHWIDGSAPWTDLLRAGRDELAARGVTFHSGVRALAIERKTRCVRGDDGVSHPYDVLVLATGSRANRPDSGPLAHPAAIALRNRGDAERIRAAAMATQRRDGTHPVRVLIQGGGLLGIELADALHHLGCAVTILQRSKRLMARQLDVAASQHLYEQLLDRGIAVRFDAQPSLIEGEQAVERVRLDDGTVLPCDLFVFATGTTANAELARSAGLPCGAGITIDDRCATADPAIFAIGECAEFHSVRVGTTAGAEEQARVLAEVLRGNPFARWQGTVEGNILKLRGFPLASCGLIEPGPDSGCEVVVLADPGLPLYQKAVIKEDRLVGIIMLGATTGFAEHRDLIRSRIELEDRRSQLLRLGGTGSGGPKGRLICSCNQVGDEDIRTAADACGGDLAKTCERSRAGTACGSCRPEVARLLAARLQTATAQL